MPLSPEAGFGAPDGARYVRHPGTFHMERPLGVARGRCACRAECGAAISAARKADSGLDGAFPSPPKIRSPPAGGFRIGEWVAIPQKKRQARGIEVFA